MLTPVDLRQLGYNLKSLYYFQDMSMQQTDLLLCVLNQSEGFLSYHGVPEMEVDGLCNCYTTGEMRIRDHKEVLEGIGCFLDAVSDYKNKNLYHSVILTEHLVLERKVSDKPYYGNIFSNIPNRRLVWQPPVTPMYWAYVCFNFINYYHSRDPIINKSLGGQHDLTIERITGYYGNDGANLKNYYGWRKYTDISISVMEFVLRDKIAELTEVLQYFWPNIDIHKLNQYIDFLNTDNIPNFREWYKTIDDDERMLIHRTVEQNETYKQIIADTATITPDNYREMLRKYAQ